MPLNRNNIISLASAVVLTVWQVGENTLDESVGLICGTGFRVLHRDMREALSVHSSKRNPLVAGFHGH